MSKMPNGNLSKLRNSSPHSNGRIRIGKTNGIVCRRFGSAPPAGRHASPSVCPRALHWAAAPHGRRFARAVPDKHQPGGSILRCHIRGVPLLRRLVSSDIQAKASLQPIEYPEGLCRALRIEHDTDNTTNFDNAPMATRRFAHEHRISMVAERESRSVGHRRAGDRFCSGSSSSSYLGRGRGGGVVWATGAETPRMAAHPPWLHATTGHERRLGVEGIPCTLGSVLRSGQKICRKGS
jgi:hypothetical protein